MYGNCIVPAFQFAIWPIDRQLRSSIEYFSIEYFELYFVFKRSRIWDQSLNQDCVNISLTWAMAFPALWYIKKVQERKFFLPNEHQWAYHRLRWATMRAFCLFNNKIWKEEENCSISYHLTSQTWIRAPECVPGDCTAVSLLSHGSDENAKLVLLWNYNGQSEVPLKAVWRPRHNRCHLLNGVLAFPRVSSH